MNGWIELKRLIEELSLDISIQGLTQKAKKQGWERRRVAGVKGNVFEYRIADMPSDIRKKLGFDDGSQRVISIDSPLVTNRVRVEILDIEASAGNGIYLSHEEQGLLAQEFDLGYFRQHFGRKDGKNLKIIAVKGDSMHPTLESGELLYIDVSENYFSTDGIYVFTFDGQTFVKRLQKAGRQMFVISDNPAYKEWQITESDQVYIHGRVVQSLPMKWRKW